MLKYIAEIPSLPALVLIFFFKPMICFIEETQQNEENAEISISDMNLTYQMLYSSNQMMSLEYIVGIAARLGKKGSNITSYTMLEDKELQEVNTVRSFMPKINYHHHRFDVYVFTIRLLSPTEQIRRVEIRLLNSTDVSSGTTPVKITVKQANKVLEKYNSNEDQYLDGKYSVINLTNILMPILNQRKDNITVQVAVGRRQIKKAHYHRSHIDDDALLVFFSRDHGYFHDIYTHFLQKNAPPRGKRAVLQSKRKRHGHLFKKRKICQLMDFEIDFGYTSFGQEILYPKKFNARQCTGACPSPISNEFKPTNHAMLQSLMRLGRPKIAPMPACVPISYKQLKIIYRTENDEVVTKTHENMIATACGCR